MSQSPDPPNARPSGEAPALRPDRLGVFAVAFFVIAAAAPIAAVVGASPVIFAASGPATPAIYVFAALLIALFSVGYLRMSREVSSAAGFVAYMAKGLGPRWATGGAGIAVLTYLALQSGLWSQFGVFARDLVTGFGGPEIPVYIWIAGAIVLTTLLTMKGVDASFKVLGVIIVGETGVVAALVVALILRHGWGIFDVGAFRPENVFGQGLGVSLLFAFTCFTCFEATVVFSEEAVNPRRTIPRALYLVIAFVGLFYGLSTWAIGGAVGGGNIQGQAAENPAGLVFDLATDAGGEWLRAAMQILVVTSFLAMLLGLSNMFARYLFALGRAGVLPLQLSIIRRNGAPATAALTNGVAILVIITCFSWAGADPILTVYAWLVALGTASFIAMLILTSVAIVLYFARHRTRGSAWVTTGAPVLSTLAFTVIGYLAITNYDALLGGAGGVAKWLLVLIPVAFAAGLGLARVRPAINYDSKTDHTY